MLVRFSSFVFLVACLLGCEPEGSSTAPESVASSPKDSVQTQAGPPDETGLPAVAFLGDSISAGLHLAQEAAYPNVLAKRFREVGDPFRLINAGISGDTTAGGRARLDWILRQRPRVLVVQLGANDGLRGTPISSIRENLRAILEGARKASTEVLLLGMRLPPNYGEPYTTDFEKVYKELAQEFAVTWIPFFMEGVAGVDDLNLPDGIHPTEEGHQRLAQNVESKLREILQRLEP